MAKRGKGTTGARKAVRRKAKGLKKPVPKIHHKVICQEWEESERGWGTRPDGYTLHLTHSDRAAYVDTFYKEHNSAASVPDEYTRVSGNPFEVEIGPKTYKELAAAKKEGKQGIWGKGPTFPVKQRSTIATSDLP